VSISEDNDAKNDPHSRELFCSTWRYNPLSDEIVRYTRGLLGLFLRHASFHDLGCKGNRSRPLLEWRKHEAVSENDSNNLRHSKAPRRWRSYFESVKCSRWWQARTACGGYECLAPAVGMRGLWGGAFRHPATLSI
jgi:hypothetical protein